MMVAAWEPDPSGDKSQRPVPIPAEIFHAYLVGRLPAGHLSLRTAKHVPDFVVKIAGDVPLPDNDVPLVGVLFRDNSVKALTMSGAKLAMGFRRRSDQRFAQRRPRLPSPGTVCGQAFHPPRGQADRDHQSNRNRPAPGEPEGKREAILAERLSADHRDVRAEGARRAVALPDGAGAGSEGGGRGQPGGRRDAEGKGDGGGPQPPARSCSTAVRGRKRPAGAAEGGCTTSRAIGGIRTLPGQGRGGRPGGFRRRLGCQRRRGAAETGPNHRSHGTRSVGRLGGGLPNLARRGRAHRRR